MTAVWRAPDRIRYLDAVAGSRPGRDYKRRLFEVLDVQPGHTVLDVGCGPGTDLAALAGVVGPTGQVVGVDNDARMVAVARRRTADLPGVAVQLGDAHELPVADRSVDRARADRVLQHVSDPLGAVGELTRVLRPGGMLGLAEPDWDTLVVEHPDTRTSRAFTRFLAARVRNGTLGRHLGRLVRAAGLSLVTATPTSVVFPEFALADQILGLRRNTERAVAAGQLDPLAARQWLDGLARQSREDRPFRAAVMLVIVTARRR